MIKTVVLLKREGKQRGSHTTIVFVVEETKTLGASYFQLGFC